MRHDHFWHNIRLRIPRLLVLSSVFVASMLIDKVGTIASAWGRACLVGSGTMSTKRFSFQHFESLSEGQRILEAQIEVERLFPPGSKASNFTLYFRNSGANCFSAEDYWGPAIICKYRVSEMGFVSTEWIVVARLDTSLSYIDKILVNRDITGL